MPRALAVTEYWEDGRTPGLSPVTPGFRAALTALQNSPWHRRMQAAPGCSPEAVQAAQFERVRELVTLAYARIPLYRDKYRACGFEPGDLKTWADYHRLPLVTKDEMIAAYPARCVDPAVPPSDLFHSRSSGSSGKTLRIAIDPWAIMADTLQGVRQFGLQTGGQYGPEDLLVHVYTVPWWVDSLAGDYPSVFVSSLIPPPRVAALLAELRPQVLSLYPTNLAALLPHVSPAATAALRAVVVHSEMSHPHDRARWAESLGCPVLDEYSSEELTRIALELPCGHYHLCEDTVRLDCVDAADRPLATGVGRAVGTNLLNTAMPFIRYVQGDLVAVAERPACPACSWRTIERVEGRDNDCFRTATGEVIPAGTLLDVTYRWMFDNGLHIHEFELVQRAPTAVTVTIADGQLGADSALAATATTKLRGLLQGLFPHELHLDVRLVDRLPPARGKRRAIRREPAAQEW